MKYLVFGNSGFVGRNLVKFLEEKGEEVHGASRSVATNAVSIDIVDETAFSKIDFKPDVIVNCASLIPRSGKFFSDPVFLKELFLTNVVGGVNIANWAIESGVSKYINCSTLSVVKRPWPDPLRENYNELPDGKHVAYGMSKLSQEQVLNEVTKNTELEVMHLRLSAVYGPGMVSEGILFNLLSKFRRNENIELTDGKKNTLDFIHVKDVCRVIHAFSKLNNMPDIVNVAQGNQISILGLAEQLKKITNSVSEINSSETDYPPSVSNIDIETLKKRLPEVVKKFIPFGVGLQELVGEYS